MPRYRMKVRRIIEEFYSIIIEAESDVKAHSKAEAIKIFSDAVIVSASRRTSVVACHNISEGTPTKGG